MPKPQRLACVSVLLIISLAAAISAAVYPVGDLNEDRVVDFRDVEAFAAWWLDESCVTDPGCEADLSGGDGVDGVDFAILAANWLQRGTTVVINEFMASNGSSEPLEDWELLDEDGASSDWIELYNPTNVTVDIGGWYLTDDAGNPRKWAFPAGVMLKPGEFLIVFASGKNRATAGAALHTNFQLDADQPEYLGLFEADGVTVAHEYSPTYPRQLPNISYGLAQYATSLVAPDGTAAYRVPTVADAGKDWTALDFADTAWARGPSGLGFGNATPGFKVTFFKANTAVGHLSTAEQVIANPSLQSQKVTATAPYINYYNTGGAGNYANDMPFPGTVIGNDVEDFVILATGMVLIPATGNWTFGVNSDDGFGLTLSRGSDTFSTSYPDPRGSGDTLATFNITQAGVYDLRLVFYERGGGSCLELFAAQGGYSSFNSAAFDLVGHTANGGLAVSSYGSDVATDVQSIMQNINASLWTRFTFQAEEVDSYDSLSLRMRYEDGFVAWLNGVEVARSNFTGAPAWNSKAASDRSGDLTRVVETFDLSNHLPLLRDGRNVLAVQGLNDAAADGSFLVLPELLAASNQTVAQYLAKATPGSFNTSGSVNRVGDTTFSRDRGFYSEPFYVTISTETPGATIMYTRDGSAPSETHGTEYTGPIPILLTTCLRAIAFKPGWLGSNVDTQTYIFLDQVITQPAAPFGFPSYWGSQAADYEMDPDVVNNPSYSGEIRDDLLALPTMSIVMKTDDMFGTGGIYSNWGNSGVAWERPCSVELFHPDGREGFQVDCGIRIYGGVGRREQKKTFRLLFKRQYGPTKLRYNLFDRPSAVDEFDCIILRAGFNNSWHGVYDWSPQYLRDEWIRVTQLDMDQPGLHGTFVHLYVNGLYWGVYNPTERANADFGASYLGGDKAEYDALNSYPRNVVDGTADAWIAAQTIAAAGVADQAGYNALAQYVDIENLIDYMCLNFYGGNLDWDDHNWYSVRRRLPGEGWKFISWDSERVLEDITGHNRTGVGQYDKPSYLYSALRANPEFRMQFADRARVHFFHGGALTEESARARYKALADLMYAPIVCESARWGDNKSTTPRTRNVEWIAERNRLLNQYFPQRTQVALGFLRGAGLYPSVDAPEFLVGGRPQHGGQVTPGQGITIAALFGTVYYTLDGSDPRLPGGAPNPAAQVFEGGGTQLTFVPENANKRALVPAGPVSNNWRGGAAFDDSTWLVCSGNPGGIGFERSTGYEPYITLNVNTQMQSNNSCLVRIPFSVGAEDIQRISSLTLKARYDDGFVAYLNGQFIARRNFAGEPQWNSGADGLHDDSLAVNFESIDVSEYLSALKAGNNILAIHALNITSGGSDFLISVELAGIIPNEQSSINLDRSAWIKTRARDGSVWSALTQAGFSVGPVADSLRITELMYHPAETGDPDDPNAEYVELKNIGPQTINLNLVRFTNGVSFTFPNITLGPNQYVLVVRDTAVFQARYGTGLSVAGQYSGSLDNAGERIALADASGREIHNFRYKDGWYGITDGKGFSLTIRDATDPDPNTWDRKDGWRPSATPGGSPGYDDTGLIPDPGSIVINEALAHSHAGAPDWIELYNTTGRAINIGGWFLSDNDGDDASRMKYRIPDGTSIDAYGFLVFFEDLHFGNGASLDARIPFALSENGEVVVLSSAAGEVLTGYRVREDFDASPTGVSFGRYYKASTDTWNFVLMSQNTPGWENAYPMVGPIVINELMYNPVGGNQDQEYIELHNITGSPVTLFDFITSTPWRFTDGIQLTFPTDPPLTIPAGGYALVVKNAAAFAAKYGAAPAGVAVLEYEDGNLDNGGEKVELSMPGDVDSYGNRCYIRIDRVNYSDGSHPVGGDPWPTGPDGNGSSLSRILPAAYGNDVANWKAAAPSPGAANP